MTLKELKEIIKGKRIDRIAAFCDSYEQMFDRCRLYVHNGSVKIDTFDDDNNDDQFEPVPKVIDQLLAMPSEYDNYSVLFTGLDNKDCNYVLVRNLSSAKIMQSPQGTGICLLGREPLKFIDHDDFFKNCKVAYRVQIIIEDPRARKLNDKFMKFLDSCCYWPIASASDWSVEDNWDIYSRNNFTARFRIRKYFCSTCLVVDCNGQMSIRLASAVPTPL